MENDTKTNLKKDIYFFINIDDEKNIQGMNLKILSKLNTKINSCRTG